jgi:hypothetical protein
MLNTISARKAQEKSHNFRLAQLELFGVRCGELAAQALAGQIPFIDAVDMAYSAAIWAGIVDSAGDDVVQAIMANAFADARVLLS